MAEDPVRQALATRLKGASADWWDAPHAVMIPTENGPAPFGSVEAATAMVPIWGVDLNTALEIMRQQIQTPDDFVRDERINQRSADRQRENDRLVQQGMDAYFPRGQGRP